MFEEGAGIEKDECDERRNKEREERRIKSGTRREYKLCCEERRARMKVKNETRVSSMAFVEILVGVTMIISVGA